MKKILGALSVLVCGIVLSAANIFLAGDSTCASYKPSRAPLTGWGQVLQNFCKDGVTVNNYALSGRSTKSFIEKGNWDKLLKKVKPGDFVLIQFGHNDGSRKNPEKFADYKTDYPNNLRKMIDDVLAKGGVPIIVTSIVRAKFSNGKLMKDSLSNYVDAAISVAKEKGVAYIDFNSTCAKKIAEIGEEQTLSLYMCKSGLKDRKNDTTHLNQKGAMTLTSWFVEEAKATNSPVAVCFK